MEESTESTEPTEPTVPAMHPEVKKAMDEVAALKKQLETVAKAYEICGKKVTELAPKLYALKMYALKKAGGTAYDDYIGLLDEMESTAESGIFKECGSNRSNPARISVDAAVAELRVQFPALTPPEAAVTQPPLTPLPTSSAARCKDQARPYGSAPLARVHNPAFS